MPDIVASARLTHQGVLKMLNAAIGAAETAGTPMCIVVVDASGQILTSFLMDGVNFMAPELVLKKARTAASRGSPSGSTPKDVAEKLTAAMSGFTNLMGGFPILYETHLLGAIAAGGGTPDQDAVIAKAGLAALGFAVPDQPKPSER